jgi:hypothetical protein
MVDIVRDKFRRSIWRALFHAVVLLCCAPVALPLWLWDGVKNFWYAYRQAWSAIGTTRFFDYL